MKNIVSYLFVLLLPITVSANIGAPPTPTYDGNGNASCGWLYTPQCSSDPFSTNKNCTCVLQSAGPTASAGCGEGETPVTRADNGEIVCLDSAGSVRGSGSSRSADSPAGQCSKAIESTKKQCKGAELAQYAPAVLNLAGAMTAAKSQGNMKKACETAKQIQGISGVSNAAVAAMCQRAVSSCKKACGDGTNEEDSMGVGQCEEYEKYGKAATMQAVQSATDMVGSQACIDAASGNECLGQDAYNNENCTQFCMKPGRQDHPKCKIAFNNCSNAEYAAQNVQYCTCLNNPFAPNCTNVTGLPPAGVPPPSSPNFDDGMGGAGDYDFNAAGDKGSPAAVNQAGGGGGGFSGAGGSSFGFGDDGGGGGPNDPINKDVLTGTGGGAGGAYVGGGGGYNEGGAGMGRGGSGGSSDEKGLDLRAFLPGGKKDPTRNPASAGYDDPTITKANGLTNWQKVTRKMNEKRVELMP